ncbi:MAG: hypothetical protein NTV32_00005, partial [Gammaproteobacteria bacterium]|nr:hypothetical protein [Gammaproteobacteria bacterium]
MDHSLNLLESMVIMRPIATFLFFLAVIHTFIVGRFHNYAGRFRDGSIGENLFRFLGEVEVVFGLWAALLISIWSFKFGSDSAVLYLESVNFTEAAFVFVVMCISATKPIMTFTKVFIKRVATFIPGNTAMAQYFTILFLGSIAGSIITEPAAMTLVAFFLRDNFFCRPVSQKFKYASLGLLFVNISIGGTLTNFAAPPVLMVAGPWGWSTAFMMQKFGWKAILAIFVSTILTTIIFYRELSNLTRSSLFDPEGANESKESSPWWLVFSHMFFLGLTIYHSHHMAFFVPLFLLFLGWCAVTAEHQSEIRLKESLLVACFLGGLVTLGKLQDWWLQPLVARLSDKMLYFGAMGLTAVTDNAAITYLGSLVPNLSDSTKYFLVAGAIAGGGLTVIA